MSRDKNEISILEPSPKLDENSSIYYTDIMRSRILNGGRIMFRGDNRPPEEIFENGFTPKEDSATENLLFRPFASNSKKVVALTPYFNTAAIFPSSWEPISETWVYIIKIDENIPIIPIAHASISLLSRERDRAGDYPAEHITAGIPEQNVIAAVRVRRNTVCAQSQDFAPDGTFEILEIKYNGLFKSEINSPLREYLQYLLDESQKKEERGLPFNLEGLNNGSKYKPQKFPEKFETYGLRQLSSDLIAQKSKQCPAEAIKSWIALLPLLPQTNKTQTKRNPTQKDIEDAAEHYPQILELLNPEELLYLLNQYEGIPVNSNFFRELTNQLPNILKNKAESKILKDIVDFFIKSDHEGKFVGIIQDHLRVQDIKLTNICGLLSKISKKNNPWNKLLCFLVLKKPISSEISGVSQKVSALTELFKVHRYLPDRERKKNISNISDIVDNISVNNLPDVINSLATECSGSAYNELFKIILREIYEMDGGDVVAKLASPVMSVGGHEMNRIISPIISAVKAGNLELVRLWVGLGASLSEETTPTNRHTPLMTAIRYKQREIAEFILEQAKGNGENIGLHLKNSSGEGTEDLIEHKKNPEFDKIISEKIKEIRSRPRLDVEEKSSFVSDETILSLLAEEVLLNLDEKPKAIPEIQQNKMSLDTLYDIITHIDWKNKSEDTLNKLLKVLTENFENINDTLTILENCFIRVKNQNPSEANKFGCFFYNPNKLTERQQNEILLLKQAYLGIVKYFLGMNIDNNNISIPEIMRKSPLINFNRKFQYLTTDARDKLEDLINCHLSCAKN
jgi:hypothetical protein